MPVVCLSLLLAVAAVNPRVWVVDTAAPTASDTNPGTADQPLKTLSRVADQAGPGDTVVVRAGVYREAVNLHRSGTPAAPITFLAADPGTVEINGADPVTTWTRRPGEAPIYQTPWTPVFAVGMDNGKPVVHHPGEEPRWGRAEQVIVDGNQAVVARDLDELTQLWTKRPAKTLPPTPWPDVNKPETWPGCFAVDVAKHELYLWLADGGDPAAHNIESSSRGLTFGCNPWANRAGVHDVHVRGFRFKYGASFPQRAVVWLHGHDNVLEDCDIEQMSGSGVNVGGTMRRCRVTGCGHCGGGANGNGFLNEDCRWEGNCWKPINRGWDAGGFKMALVDGGIFRRCVFRHNGGPGLWFDIDVRNVLVTECVFEGNEGTGLMVEISRDIQIVHNLVLRNAVGEVSIVKGADWASGGILCAESERVIIAGNTCVGNKDGITFREQGPRDLDTPDGRIPYHDTGDVVTGNLLADNRGYQLGLWYDSAFFGWHPAEHQKYGTLQAYDKAMAEHPEKIYDPRAAGHVIDRNFYAPAAGEKLWLYGCDWRPRSVKYTELAAVIKDTGFEARGLVGEPGFVDAAHGDYRLKPDSAARAAGAGWANAPREW
jgi:hypothetical protein